MMKDKLIWLLCSILIFLGACSDNQFTTSNAENLPVAPEGSKSVADSPVVTTEVNDLGKMFEVKASWGSLSDITDENIVCYPALCESENSGLRDLERGMEFYADNMIGIQRFLGVETEEECEVDIGYQIDATDMELVLIKADGSVEHFSQEKEESVSLSMPKGKNVFGVAGYKGSGSVSVWVNTDTVTLDKMLMLTGDKEETRGRPFCPDS